MLGIRNFTKIYVALYDSTTLVSIWGAQIWPPETNRNICLIWVLLQMRVFIAWGTHEDFSNIYSETRNVGNVFNPRKSFPGNLYKQKCLGGVIPHESRNSEESIVS